jgi:hypothetical protein
MILSCGKAAGENVGMGFTSWISAPNCLGNAVGKHPLCAMGQDAEPRHWLMLPCIFSTRQPEMFFLLLSYRSRGEPGGPSEANLSASPSLGL